MYFLLSFSGWGLEGQPGLKFSWYTLNSVHNLGGHGGGKGSLVILLGLVNFSLFLFK